MARINIATSAALLLLFFAGTAAAAPFPMGVSMSPRFYPFHTDADLEQAMAQTQQLGDYGAAFWEWNEGDSGYESVEHLSRLFHDVGLGVIAQMSPTSLGAVMTPPGVGGSSFADPAVRQRYLADVDRMAALRPEYLNIAAEINLFTYLSPEEYPYFRSLYNEAYHRAKAISPETKVGASYHFDLFYLEQNFDMPGQLGPQDFIGITSYPSWLVYKGVFDSIDAIPPEYYGWLRDAYPDTPLVFTEIGWPHAGPGSLQDQADFVLALPRLLGPLEPDLVVWTLLHDVMHFNVDMLSQEQIDLLADQFNLDAADLFEQLNSMGLLTWDDQAKPAWWAALSLQDGATAELTIPEPTTFVLLGAMGSVALHLRRRTTNCRQVHYSP